MSVIMPAVAEVLDSDLFYLLIPCFCAVSLGVFLRIYAEPFRQLGERWRRSREEEIIWLPAEEMPEEDKGEMK